MDALKRIFREHPRLSIFFLAYYIVMLTIGALYGATGTPFYALFLGAAALLVAFLDARHPFSELVLWGLAVWGFAHMLGGLIEVNGDALYEIELGADQLRFDKFVHFMGFGFATLASYEVLRATTARDASPRSAAIAAFFVGVGLGALNETIEFLITLLPTDSNVGGFSNTGWDLVANTLGAGLAAWAAPTLEARREEGPRLTPGAPSSNIVQLFHAV